MDHQNRECESGAKSPEELFRAYLLLARRSAIRNWLFQAAVRGVAWNALPFSFLIGFRRSMHLELPTLLSAYAGVVLVTALGCLWRSRNLVTRFAEVLDQRCHGEGRIASAAEFIKEADGNSYKRLAVGEAGYWLASRKPACSLWTWPLESYAVVPLAALMYLAYRYA